MVDALTRQIGENHETCEKLLEETNYDIMTAIKKYYNIVKKEEKKNQTSNNILFDTIREFWMKQVRNIIEKKIYKKQKINLLKNIEKRK